MALGVPTMLRSFLFGRSWSLMNLSMDMFCGLGMNPTSKHFLMFKVLWKYWHYAAGVGTVVPLLNKLHCTFPLLPTTLFISFIRTWANFFYLNYLWTHINWICAVFNKASFTFILIGVAAMKPKSLEDLDALTPMNHSGMNPVFKSCHLMKSLLQWNLKLPSSCSM